MRLGVQSSPDHLLLEDPDTALPIGVSFCLQYTVENIVHALCDSEQSGTV